MPMNILQCKLCARPFQSFGTRMCPECLEKIDEDFVTVRDYLYDHPQSKDMNKVAEATGVDRKVIIYLMEEKRLFFAEAVAGGFSCSVCGAAISEGKLCGGCRDTLAKQIEGSLSRSAPPPPPKKETAGGRADAKMHIMDRRK